jgi:hypothetical protein
MAGPACYVCALEARRLAVALSSKESPSLGPPLSLCW